jgi:hypothetical protein
MHLFAVSCIIFFDKDPEKKKKICKCIFSFDTVNIINPQNPKLISSAHILLFTLIILFGKVILCSFALSLEVKKVKVNCK